MFRRFFGRSSPPQPDLTGWWASAHALAVSPSAAGIALLREQVVDATTSPDLADAQSEFLDGLDALIALDLHNAATPLPTVETQHRVIGADVCHYLAPASLVDQVDAGGKVFVTSARLILAAGGVQQWAWHSVARVERMERDVILDIKGRAAGQLRFNSYEGALVVAALANRLRRP